MGPKNLSVHEKVKKKHWVEAVPSEVPIRADRKGAGRSNRNYVSSSDCRNIGYFPGNGEIEIKYRGILMRLDVFDKVTNQSFKTGIDFDSAAFGGSGPPTPSTVGE